MKKYYIMDGSPCLQCNLYVANKFRRFMDGPYAQAFCIESNPANQHFVKNPRASSQCNTSDVVCYDIRYGASPCRPNQTQFLSYDAQGQLVLINYKK